MSNEYEAKQAARKARLEARAEQHEAEAGRRFGTARAILAPIPPGQPILVGHHSEGRHRAALKRHDQNMRAGIEAEKAAEETARRAAAVGTGGISSDDPEAIAKLRSELASVEASQRQMAAINKAWRAAGKPAADNAEGWRKVADHPEVMMNPNDLHRVRVDMARDPLNRGPFPAYALSNNNANAHRIARRIEELQRRDAEPERPPVRFNGGELVEDKADNRVLLIFDTIPAKEIREDVKGHGFRWSPNRGAWVRKLGTGARFWGLTVMTRHLGEPIAEAEAPAIDTAAAGE